MTEVTENRAFERFVTAVIVANAVVMLWGLLDHGREELLENVDLAFLSFFGAELLVRLAKARLGFFKNPWRCADAAIIVLALLPVLGGGVAVLRIARLAKLAHLGRHANHLRGITALRLPLRVLQRRSATLKACGVAVAVTVVVALGGGPTAHADDPDTMFVNTPNTADPCPSNANNGKWQAHRAVSSNGSRSTPKTARNRNRSTP